MTKPTIGVLGGYGAVGLATARRLLERRPDLTIRIGGRDRERAGDAATALGDGCEPVTVDLDDPDSLLAFCRPCDLVINCAGPSYQVLDTVARAALEVGADYVDPGGDEIVLEKLAGVDVGSRRVVLNAGMMPGLTALLPRWLVENEIEEPRRMTAYIGTMDRLTPAGAADYLLSLGGGHGEAGAAIRGGTTKPKVLNPLSDVELPFFTGTVSAYPFISRETARMAEMLAVDEVDWYNVFDGGAHMMNALSRLQGAMAGEGDLEAAADELTQAAALDLFGREPYQLMVIEVAGLAEGDRSVKTIVLRGNDTYELTGFLAVEAALAVLDGTVDAGVHLAAEVLDPTPVVDRLEELAAVTGFSVIDNESATGLVVEGAL